MSCRKQRNKCRREVFCCECLKGCIGQVNNLWHSSYSARDLHDSSFLPDFLSHGWWKRADEAKNSRGWIVTGNSRYLFQDTLIHSILLCLNFPRALQKSSNLDLMHADSPQSLALFFFCISLSQIEIYNAIHFLNYHIGCYHGDLGRKRKKPGR